MKKKKIFWILFIFVLLLFINSFFMSSTGGALTGKDDILYKVSAILLFGIILCGFLFELNVFHIKDKFPSLKKKSRHILFWVCDICLAVFCCGIVQSQMSSQYETVSSGEEVNISENIQTSTETESLVETEVSEVVSDEVSSSLIEEEKAKIT